MNLATMKLKHRLMALMGITVTGIAIIGLILFNTLAHLEINGPLYLKITQEKDLVADILPPPEYLIESYLVSLELVQAPPDQRQRLINRLKTLQNDYDTRHEFWAKAQLDTETNDLLLNQTYKPAQAFYQVAFNDFIPALQKGDTAAANAALTTLKQNYDQHRAGIDSLVTLANKHIDANETDATEEISSAKITALAVMLIISALLITAFAIFARNLLSTLGCEPHDATDILNSIAQGDLTIAIDPAPNDRSSLLFAAKTMKDSLTTIVDEVRAGTASIASASGQIAAGNLDLSNRTEAQAGSLEETASAMEQLTSTVKQNADNARQANQLAETASEVATKGGEVVTDVVNTMSAINESARKIADIIGVIDGIAFQTNILALNAAVEAARAGEQGRGFAVVATEVRSLAQRSAAAAKEIKLLIDDSVEKVEQGNKQASQAGATMGEVVSSVHRVTDIMSEISAASREQSQGIEEVNRAINHMDEATQQNAVLVEEAAAAARSLQGQATHLEELVDHFKSSGVPQDAAGNRLKHASPSRVQHHGQQKLADNTMNLDSAITAHGEWKTKFRSAISKHEQMDAKTISADNCCMLGKWLYGPAKHQFGSLASYAETMKRHAAFHTEAGRVANLINARKYAEATMALDAGTPYTDASSAVGMAILNLKKDTGL
jgi:methyl-accepting chemotaxis protein